MGPQGSGCFTAFLQDHEMGTALTTHRWAQARQGQGAGDVRGLPGAHLLPGPPLGAPPAALDQLPVPVAGIRQVATDNTGPDFLSWAVPWWARTGTYTHQVRWGRRDPSLLAGWHPRGRAPRVTDGACRVLLVWGVLMVDPTGQGRGGPQAFPGAREHTPMMGTQDRCVCAVGTVYVPATSNRCVGMKGSKGSLSTGAGPWKDLFYSPPASLRSVRPALGSSWWT